MNKKKQSDLQLDDDYLDDPIKDNSDQLFEKTPWQREHEAYQQWKKEQEQRQDSLQEYQEENDEDQQEDQQEYQVEKDVDMIDQNDDIDDDKRKKRLLYRRVSVLLTLFLLGAAVMFYWISPYNKIGAIIVEGNQNITTEDILKAAEFSQQDTLWGQYLNKAAHMNNIKKRNPKIEQAILSFKPLNTLVIHIKEYPVVGYAEEKGKWHPVLSNGTILNEIVSDQDQLKPLFIGFQDKSDKLKQMLSVYESLDPVVQENIEKVINNQDHINPYAVTLDMRDGNQVIGILTDLSEKMVYYASIAHDMEFNGIIDMEAGIYTSPYPNDQELKSNEEEQDEVYQGEWLYESVETTM